MGVENISQVIPGYLTTEQVAGVLRLSPQMVRRLKADLGGVDVPGILFPVRVVERIAAARAKSKPRPGPKPGRPRKGERRSVMTEGTTEEGEAVDNDKFNYLWEGGWIQNRRGWWHPPNCVASWPLDQAFNMARRDEGKGLRMSAEEVKEYLSEDRA